jgi:threonylcarbamoyladenosine tRNA methylthiotransferase MtaB
MRSDQGRDRPGVWYHTFGCKANQYDTEHMRQELEARGAASVLQPEEAEVAVINTCTVTNQADADARRLIRRLRRERPGLFILVAGCSTALHEADYRGMPEVDAVVVGQDPFAVAAALANGSDRLANPSDHDLKVPAAQELLQRQLRGTRAWLKVQDGCDRKCSFCATRLARGDSRSRHPDEVVREATALSRSHPELVITGIHIGHYGHDLEEPLTLGGLCERLLESVDVRLRLSSIEATEIDDHTLDLMAAAGGQLAPHFHIPLQSGSDRVLRLMRRWHTREAYRRRVLEIAERLPVLGLGADIIVGFPGEGAEEYADTRALVEELPYTYLHVFPFSVRDGTVAAALPDLVRGDVAAERSRELRAIGLVKGQAYRARRVGARADIVVEGDGAAVSGLTGDYLRVEVPETGLSPGDRFEARLRTDGDGRLCVAAPAPELQSEPLSATSNVK